jgi:hypothetical protein
MKKLQYHTVALVAIATIAALLVTAATVAEPEDAFAK